MILSCTVWLFDLSLDDFSCRTTSHQNLLLLLQREVLQPVQTVLDCTMSTDCTAVCSSSAERVETELKLRFKNSRNLEMWICGKASKALIH